MTPPIPTDQTDPVAPATSSGSPAGDDTNSTAQAAASTAADEGSRVAGVAGDQAKHVAGEATTQVRNVLDEAQTQIGEQLGEQTTVQRDRLVETLGSLTDELDRMVEGQQDPGPATDLVRQAADRARSVAEYLDGREPGRLLSDVRDYARRRPGTFLLGALAAGVVAGRIARGAKESHPDSPPDPTTDAPDADALTTGAPTTAAGVHAAGGGTDPVDYGTGGGVASGAGGAPVSSGTTGTTTAADSGPGSL